jgi:multidrug efflux pump subunit AcrB
MVRYLIQRPIAVIISFIAIVVVGLTVAGLLPVSLLPDINIPEITVYVSHPNTNAADLERSIVAGLRTRLLQLPGLEDIQSETRDNKAIVRLKFNYGINTDIAFIDVNDKVDAAMAGLPRDVRRPVIIKASATDIPVFLLNISLSSPVQNREGSKFMELSGFTETVIRKRIEQLNSVAFADVTGAMNPELYIIPDKARCQSLGVTVESIESTLVQNNISVSGIMVRDGQLQYSLIFKNELRTSEDVKNVLIPVHGQPMPLKDLAEVGIRQQAQQGLYLSQGKQAICLALVKSSDAKIETMREEVNGLINQMRDAYPEISFETSQDQSYLLSFTIDNLRSNLLQGCFLAIFVMFLFIRDYRSPLLIALTLPVTLIISLFFFYLFGISINIVSLSGLILGVGMMIDNSIVVIDNIIQHQQRGSSLVQSIVGGTNEVIAPMISSTLTSCAVFMPLIFLSGIAGAMFYDQAIAIAIGQGISLVVSITLTPTLYHLVNKRRYKHNEIGFLSKIKLFDMEQSYVKGFDYIFRHQAATAFFLLLILAGGFFAYKLMDKRTLPVLPETEAMLTIDWNQNIHVDENKRRIVDVLKLSESIVEQSNAFIGEQQFLMNPDLDLSPYETSLYLKVKNQEDLKKLRNMLGNHLRINYPTAIFNFSSPENPFMKVFSGKESQLTARIRSLNSNSVPQLSEIEKLSNEIGSSIPASHEVIPLRQQYLVKALPEMLFRYNTDIQSLITVLKTAFNNNYSDKLMADDRYIPVVIGSMPMTMEEAVLTLFVTNRNGLEIPVRNLIAIEVLSDYRTIYGGREGVFIPINIDVKANATPEAIKAVEKLVARQANLQVSFSGSYFSNRKLIKEMSVIFLISALLLFFILAAQFESLSTPLIVLAELPIDLAFALIFLWLAGSSVNAMSLIGFIVMGGIIINDSILKIDTINQLRKEGYELMDAIHEGGRRRLKPIVMTALVTVIALLPQMLGSNLGAKLQLPLSIAMLGGMTAGTLVSLWIIPLLYYHTIAAGRKIMALFRNNHIVNSTTTKI